MKVKLAKSAGFCFGVRRAVSMCLEASEMYTDCVTLGPIIHNEHVISELIQKGVRPVKGISEITTGDTVIIRSHGIGRKEYDDLSKLGVRIIDATCPDVKKIHDIVSGESARGRKPVIIGEKRHPEITAISGWCDNAEVFQSRDELEQWLCNADNAQIPVSVVFQTTNTKAVYDGCVATVKKVCTNYKIFDTICGATCRRQQEAAELSKNVDVMIVAGGKESANSLRLADICAEYCSRVIFVESAEDLESADIRASDIVGVTAGASTPAWIIKEVTHKMSQEVNPNNTQDESEFGIEDSELVAAQPEADTTIETEIEPEIIEETSTDVSDITPEEDTITKDASPAEDIGLVETDGSSETEAVLKESDDERALTTAADPEPKDEGEAVETEEKADITPTATDDTEPESDESDESSTTTESFEEMLEKSIKTLHTGEKVTGVVTSITATEVSVDLGTKQSGYIPITEFTDESNSNIEDIVHVGDTIETFVMRVNDVEGMVMLSKKRLDAVKNWDVIEAAKENRTVMEGVVSEENKGGVVVNVKGVRVFVPASQTGLPKSSPMSDLVKKPVKLRITEVNQSRRRVVGSIRAVQADERREKSDQLWGEIEVGKQYAGVVKSMTSYGVFVDIGGVDGMIHISELSWTRIKQPSEVMAVGDEVSVYVLSFEKENRKISLGYKKREDNPWTIFTRNHAVGDVVKAKVVKMMPFGAFAEIIPGVDGLIHISQITDHRIGLPSEVLSNEQVVDVKITEIDNDRRKVSLSIRALIEPSSEPLDDNKAAELIADAQDKTPVIVYDTDSPPVAEDEDVASDEDVAADDTDEPAEVIEPAGAADAVEPAIAVDIEETEDAEEAEKTEEAEAE